jgi:uncharacterized repeat protein (TIGR03803 family)
MRLLRILPLTAVLVFAASPAVRAQTYDVIHDFGPLFGPEPASPIGHLTLGPDGNFYGVSFFGGDVTNCPLGCGTVFRLDSSGDVTTIHEFAGGEDGQFPSGDLLLASDGNFYGVTSGDGDLVSCDATCGSVYRIDTNGNFAVIHTFETTEGFGPNEALIEPQPGDLWGTTIVGPVSACLEDYSCGTVFRMHFDGGIQTMHTFSFDEGHHPIGPLVLAADGNLYGATSSNGSMFPDGVFQVTQNGNLTPFHAFDSDCNDVRDGLASVGGDLIGACGGTGGESIFRLTLGGNLQPIHTFPISGVDGAAVLKPMQASDGLLYGVAQTGGAHSNGTIWQLSLNGGFTKLHDFDVAGGSGPFHGLAQSPDGRFYGLTSVGGANDAGTLYRLTMPGLARLYCPDSFVRRDQMAVFLLKIIHGPTYTPPDCIGVFGDVTCPSLFADWIEQLAAEGITAGCAGGNYCPLSPVTRGQMAVFLLKTEHGPAYTPPACTGVFPDVPCSHQFAAWIEQLFAEGITAGCGTGFCPDTPVTRAQMAVFLLKIEHGGSYQPPPCHPQFADVTCPSLFAAWIQQLYEEHITAGCAGPP